MPSEIHADVLVAGAGLIGLALALELDRRGARVVVLDRGFALGQASVAAAGMLAADDPHNPTALAELSRFSLGLYPAFLERLAALANVEVPFQTDATLQYSDDGSIMRLREHSLDPRQLAMALRAALPRTAIRLHENLGPFRILEDERGVAVQTDSTHAFRAQDLVHTSGAWALNATLPGSIRPVKGQMLRVAVPPALGLREVHRSAAVYVVPRTLGPQAGTALIGATLEEAGFDTSVHPEDLAELRRRAAQMLPGLADAQAAPQVEAWAGLRPSTPDYLPLLGPLRAAEPGSASGPGRQWVATGHFRNGILLAPGTAIVMADLLEGLAPPVALDSFAPARFRVSEESAAIPNPSFAERYSPPGS